MAENALNAAGNAAHGNSNSTATCAQTTESERLYNNRRRRSKLFKFEYFVHSALKENHTVSITEAGAETEAKLKARAVEGKIKMVLPFGLGPDGKNLDAINSADMAPSAPPANLLTTQYPRAQTNIYTSVPIIPNPYIDFIVVNGSDRYMIRCERRCVLERSVELAKLIHAGPNSGRRGDNHFLIQNVDKDDFELIIRYMETRFLRYRDHKHLLKILELADRFNVPDLIIYCIRELDLNISSDTVLDIFRALWFYQGIKLTIQRQTFCAALEATTTATATAAAPAATTTATAAPTTKANKKKAKKQTSQQSTASVCTANNEQPIPNPNPFTTEDYSVALLHNALQLIDMQAELVLTLSAMNELRFEEFETIVKRDSLQLRTDLTLYECLADWSLVECRRKNLEPNAENRRRVLGPLCYMPRYLLMTPVEFRKACDRVELLNPTEVILINEILAGKNPKNLTDQQNMLLDKFREIRPPFPKVPVHLSDRSHPNNYPKKMRQLDEDAPRVEETCLEKVGINCLRVFACIFD